MASIQKSGNKWRVQVFVAGVRDSTTRPTRQEAAQWALEREAELRGTKLPDRTLKDALRRFADEVSPQREGARWELLRLKAFEADALVKRRIAALGADDFADWRDKRLTQVKPATVAREMNLLRSVFEVARRDWKWIRENHEESTVLKMDVGDIVRFMTA